MFALYSQVFIPRQCNRHTKQMTKAPHLT
uniref:Uncharacterized protein n=1 Tax=Anguilla anguilla TaxID=7936 RepID=A0A0E9PJ25_ANGAN